MVCEDDIMFDVIERLWRRQAVMGLVVRGRGIPRPCDAAGVITKERVADSVAGSVTVISSLNESLEESTSPEAR